MSEALLVAAPARAPAATDATAPRCQNCGAALGGPYCASCGQRREPHIHSLPHFAAEAAETLTHADSRLWRTLGHLLARPGRLTREFMTGRRARYLPPFRLYVVVSLLYFVLIAVLPDAPAPISLNVGSAETAQTDWNATAATPGGDPPLCTNLDYRGPGEDRLRPALQRACRNVAADRGQALATVFMQNVPRALFVFLPLIAAVAMLLYWRPRRYYVEHLLFFLHNHSAVFVVLGSQAIISAIPGTAIVETPLGFAVAAYLLWYPYRALRVVYGQRRGPSLAKYLVLGFAYLLLGGLMLLVTALYSALTL
jgi:hypothetical protein